MGRARDKIAAIKWAQNLIASDNWVVLNTQSTSYTAAAAATEIAVMSNTGELLFHSPVQLPAKKRPKKEDLERLGKTREELLAGPPFPEVAEQLSSHLTGKKVVTYNRSHREGLLFSTARDTEDGSLYWLYPRAHSVELDSNPKMKAKIINWEDCLMERYAAFVGEWFKTEFDYQVYKRQKLPLEKGEEGAVGGCRAALRLIQKMAEEPLPKLETKPKTRKPEPQPKHKKAGCLTSLFLSLTTVGILVAFL